MKLRICRNLHWGKRVFNDGFLESTSFMSEWLLWWYHNFTCFMSNIISTWMWNTLWDLLLLRGSTSPGLLITMPFSCSVNPGSIYPQSLPKIVQKLHTYIQTSRINNARAKNTEMTKKVWRKPHNQQEMWCQHPDKMETERAFFPSVGRTKSILFRFIHFISNSWFKCWWHLQKCTM